MKTQNTKTYLINVFQALHWIPTQPQEWMRLTQERTWRLWKYRESFRPTVNIISRVTKPRTHSSTLYQGSTPLPL